MRDLRRRSILAGALAVPLTAGLPTSSATAHSACAPDGKALRAALAGLPDADATAALVRVGGTGGAGAAARACTTWRAGGPPIRTRGSGPVRRRRWSRRRPYCAWWPSGGST